MWPGQPGSAPKEGAGAGAKQILMWGGLGSWGRVRPGSGEFIKQECPVQNCILTTDKTQATSADLVIFKVHPPTPLLVLCIISGRQLYQVPKIARSIC